MTRSIAMMLMKESADRYERNAVLIAAAPSGRERRRISPTAGAQRPFEGGPQAVTFCYPVDYIPPRHRRVKRSWVRDRAFVEIRTASSSQVQIAFKIKWHHESEEVAEIIQFEGNLWWSLPGRPPASLFVEALAAGDGAAVGLLDERLVTSARPFATREQLTARKVVHDGRDDAIARVNTGATGILVVDDSVFVRDGDPLYVLWNELNGFSTRNEPIRGNRWHSRHPSFDDITDAFTFGRVFAADRVAEAVTFATQSGVIIERQATIETFLPTFVRTKPLDVQIDATFRKLLYLASRHRKVPEESIREIRAMLDRLKHVAGPDISSHDRALALRAFVNWCDAEPANWKAKYRVERRFVIDAIERINSECRRRNETSPFIQDPLSPEDELALAQLAM
jgi:hypothetical protein